MHHCWCVIRKQTNLIKNINISDLEINDYVMKTLKNTDIMLFFIVFIF